MTLNMDANSQATTNFEHLVDLDMLLSLFCIILFLEYVHNLIKFFQHNNNFVCNFVSAMKIFQAQLYYHFVDLATKFQVDVFKECHSLFDCVFEKITL
jgi:hypothetical protein